MIEFLTELKTLSKDLLKKVKTGSDFENLIENFLKKNGFSSFNKDNLINGELNELKRFFLKYNDNDNFINNYFSDKIKDNSYIKFPFGTQNYPDFFVFYNWKIIPLETKSSKTWTIMWNSWLPRYWGLYIFLSTNEGVLSFFLWEDVITFDETVLIQETFLKIKEYIDIENNRLRELDKNNTWFQIYPRKAFQQSKKDKDTIINFSKNKKMNLFENNVINKIKNLKSKLQ